VPAFVAVAVGLVFADLELAFVAVGLVFADLELAFVAVDAFLDLVF